MPMSGRCAAVILCPLNIAVEAIHPEQSCGGTEYPQPFQPDGAQSNGLADGGAVAGVQ